MHLGLVFFQHPQKSDLLDLNTEEVPAKKVSQSL